MPQGVVKHSLCYLRQLLLPLLLASVLFALYGPILTGGFVVDDELGMAREPPQFSLSALLAQAGGWGFDSTALNEGGTPFFRPIGVVVGALLHQLLGNEPFGWHLLSLLLHLTNSLLVVVIAGRLVPEAGWRVSWLSGVLFVAHPAASEAVLWVSSNAELMVALLLLLQIERLLKWRSELTPPRVALLLLLFFAGCLVKEVALSLAVIVPGWILLSRLSTSLVGKERGGVAFSWSLLVGLPLLALIYLVWRNSVIGSLAGDELVSFDPLRLGELLLVHLRYLFLPDYLPFALAPPEVALTGRTALIFALSGALFLFIWLAWQSDFRLRIGLLLLWIMFSLWPAAAIAIVGDGFFAARHAYFAAAAVSLLPALVAERLGDKRVVAWGALLAMLAWLLPVWSSADGVARGWGDNLAVYRQAAQISPSAPGPQAGMARALAAQGESRDAIAAYRAASQRALLFGEKALYLYQAAIVAVESGDLAEGKRALQDAVQVDPGSDDAWTGLGNVAWMEGRVAEAARYYRHALRLNPANREAGANLVRLSGNVR